MRFSCAAGIEDRGFIKAYEGSQIDQIITKSEDLVVAAGSVLSKFDRILGNIEDKRLEKILINLENLTLNTNKVMSNLNDKNLTQTIANFKSSSDSMSKMMTRIEEGPGTLHALIYDQGLHEDLRSLVGGAIETKS